MDLKTLLLEYRSTLEVYKAAKKKGEKEIMNRLSEDLIRIADQMERFY